MAERDHVGGAWHPSKRLRRWTKRPRRWVYGDSNAAAATVLLSTLSYPASPDRVHPDEVGPHELVPNASHRPCCRARFTKTSYCWPCEPITPPHDTFHELRARRIYCIGSRSFRRVLGRLGCGATPGRVQLQSVGRRIDARADSSEPGMQEGRRAGPGRTAGTSPSIPISHGVQS